MAWDSIFILILVLITNFEHYLSVRNLKWTQGMNFSIEYCPSVFVVVDVGVAVVSLHGTISLYRARHLVVYWVRLTIFRILPNSVWAAENLAEAAGQLGKMVEKTNQSQPNPGARPNDSPCNISQQCSFWAVMLRVPPCGPGKRSMGTKCSPGAVLLLFCMRGTYAVN